MREFSGNENWKHSDTCGWLNRESEPDTKYRIDEKNVLAKCQKQESNLYHSASSFDLSPATRLTIQKMDLNHTDGTPAALPRVLTYKTPETSGNGGSVNRCRGFTVFSLTVPALGVEPKKISPDC